MIDIVSSFVKNKSQFFALTLLSCLWCYLLKPSLDRKLSSPASWQTFSAKILADLSKSFPTVRHCICLRHHCWHRLNCLTRKRQGPIMFFNWKATEQQLTYGGLTIDNAWIDRLWFFIFEWEIAVLCRLKMRLELIKFERKNTKERLKTHECPLEKINITGHQSAGGSRLLKHRTDTMYSFQTIQNPWAHFRAMKKAISWIRSIFDYLLISTINPSNSRFVDWSSWISRIFLQKKVSFLLGKYCAIFRFCQLSRWHSTLQGQRGRKESGRNVS